MATITTPLDDHSQPVYTTANVFTSDWRFPERSRDNPPTPEMHANATLLIARVLRLLREYTRLTKPALAAEGRIYRPTITSGYRPPLDNHRVGGASKSNHLTCAAVDLADPDNTLDAWLLQNQSVLAMCGLWLEHPESTPGWVHLQCVPPASGKQVFRVK